jgi:teichuronic acid biosynthesis glycosyltransferase TuaH
MTASQRVVCLLAGSRWDDVAGTDRHLATALGQQVPVLWVDPPFSLVERLRTRTSTTRSRAALMEVAPGVTRMQFLTVPGPTRPVGHFLTWRLLHLRVRQAAAQLRSTVAATVALSPQAVFLSEPHGRRVLFVTDDWVTGASMMGLSRSHVRKRLIDNMRSADAVAAVSAELARTLEGLVAGEQEVHVIPNGCHLNGLVSAPSRAPVAGLVGQLNERLDLEALTAVAEAGIDLRIIGPRTGRDPVFARQLDRLLALPSVTWLGRLTQPEVAQHLAEIRVGLTPYRDSAFNRSSFPLKTLEYLGAGLPVVASDLPAVRWLATDLIDVADDPQDFARKVSQALREPLNPGLERQRLEFAENHTWDARASEVLKLLALL